MPVYQFTAPTGSATHDRRAEIARAVTRVHSEATGAPARYVHCSFHEMPRGSMFIGGEETASAAFEYGAIMPEASQDPGAVLD